MNDIFFANPLEFHNDGTETNTRSIPGACRRKSIELLESDIGRKDVTSGDQNEFEHLDNNYSNIKSVPTLISNLINFLTR